MENTGIDLSRNSPSNGADSDYPEELFKAAKKLPYWDERSLDCVDHILMEWTTDTLASSKNREGWTILRSLIKRIQVIQYLEDQPEIIQQTVKVYYFRWEALANLLHARACREDNHDPQKVANIPDVAKLKSIFNGENDEISRADLERKIPLSQKRLGQVLSLAEAAGLICRYTKKSVRMISASGIWKQS